MSKRKAVIVRTVIFLCVFVLAFITAGRITGVFEPGSSYNFEAFGEDESTTAKAVATTASSKKKTGEDTTAKAPSKKTNKSTTTKSEETEKKEASAKKKTNSVNATTLPSDNDTAVYRTDENGEKYREIVPEDYGKKWYSRVIVRREIRVSKDYKPDIVPILDGYGYGCSLNRVAAKPYENMFHAAEKDGYYLVPYSAYRSYDTQYGNFVNRIAQWQSQGFGRAQAIENTVEVIMAPGGSEHNLGLAVDIICTEYDFDTTAEYAWLSANAWRYGFIERYPRDSHDITGVVREPWHWRYVGLEAAKEMHGTGLTFEEYLTKKGITY